MKITSGENIGKLLMAEIREITENQERQLPSEADIAKKFGISRTQLRDYMAELENEFIITRQRGRGTRVNRHVLDIPLRMDFSQSFHDRIRAMGHEPEVDVLEMEMCVVDEFLATKLSIGVGTPVLMVAGVAKADGKPAIYCKSYFPYQIFKRMDFTRDSFRIPFFDFLQIYCNLQPDYDLSEVTPIVADKELIGILGVEEGCPLLKMEVVSYTIDELPILWSQEYYVPEMIQFTLVRKAPNDFTNQRRLTIQPDCSYEHDETHH